ncbi:MAG: DCC1-like thiol-disulfide oxidoreductase family protein [Bacteroidia bacterium]|nr:DCC1-like thiol-disulfide oxidoreductase family protein [Bacteroidia bacterium]MDW8158468.1 DCC1-like thiol-disulfide oxidoreductase family protein [Bacteroidia bacterium]
MTKEEFYAKIVETLGQNIINVEKLKGWSPLVIFDGECGFCNKCVYWLWKLDRAGILYFVRASSNLGRRILYFFQPYEKAEDSVFFIYKGNIYSKSQAVIRVLELLQVPMAGIGWWIPPFFRDFLYDCIASSRYYLINNNSTACNLEYMHAFANRLLD